MTEYQKLLSHPKWQKRRLEVLESAGWKCVLCKDTDKQLQVHHTSYDFGKKPWEYDDHRLLPLCDDCHGKTTYLRKRLKGELDTIQGPALMIILGCAIALNMPSDQPTVKPPIDCEPMGWGFCKLLDIDLDHLRALTAKFSKPATAKKILALRKPANA